MAGSTERSSRSSSTRAVTKEATESGPKIQAVAEFIPVGMCFGDGVGNITSANDAWYRITGYPRIMAPLWGCRASYPA